LETNTAIILTMLIPAAAAALNLILGRAPDLRDGVTLGAAFATFADDYSEQCRQWHNRSADAV